MNVNLITPINQLGYGVAGTNIALSLSDICDLSLWNIGNIDCPKEVHERLSDCARNAIKPDFEAPCIRIWHQHDMSQFDGKGEHIGYPIFELDRFNEIEMHHLSSLDHIFVCSHWAKNIVEENFNRHSCPPVSVIPLGVDRSIFSETLNVTEKTIFLNIGKWEIRKGHDILIEAFNSAFSKEDNVELWMMCSNPFFSPEENLKWESLYKSSKLGDKIKLIPRKETQKEVYSIMASADCGVFPSRAEGWNLELLEMMSCGKSVIATDYSAHTEFCNRKNCKLIHIDELEEANDGIWFKGQGKWASINNNAMGQLIEHMQSIHCSKKSGNEVSNKAGIETAKHFSWKNTAKRIINAISTK